MKLTLDEIKNRVIGIETAKGDFEVAHGLEDNLYIDFIQHVAESGNKKLSEMAKECLKTANIDFARYCA